VKVFKQSQSTTSFKFIQGGFVLTLVFLLVEFFDELNYSIGGAVLPAMRADLGLSYTQVGLVLGVPYILGSLIEPAIMLLGDSTLRRRLVISGGLAVALALAILANASSFAAVLFAMILSFPASGAFVSLVQATMVDLSPRRESQMMARWTLAGSLGDVLGPLLVSAGFSLALGWRWAFGMLAVAAILLIVVLLTQPFPNPGTIQPEKQFPATGIKKLVSNLIEAGRNPQLLRWTALLQISDLLLDIFGGYVALYFTDVTGASPAQAGLVIGLWMASGLASDLLLIPVLEHASGRSVVRFSAAIAVLVYPAWLLAPWVAVKIVLLALLRLSTLGWYPVLQGEAYASLPGRSGTVMAIGSLAGLFGGGLTWLVGWTANQAGLPAAMWLLLIGPLSLVLFIPPPAAETPAQDS
jgi:FSR family fosmidomycin resistance protein-like MFS transporter